ncbi:MAG: efflux transporter outer membrane subunit [Saprospiraceae bacterium]
MIVIFEMVKMEKAKYNWSSFFLMGVVVLVGVSSCKVVKDYHPIGVEKDISYRGVETTDTNSIAEIPWREIFKDSLLQELIDDALQSNLDLKVATARIKSSEAYLLQQKGTLLPRLDANAGVSIADLANVPSAASGFAAQQYQLYLSASWEADIWQKLRSAKRAAVADLLASEAFKRGVQTRIVADVANAYYNLMALDRQLAITQATVQAREKFAETVQYLKDAASVNGADVEQSKANLHSARVMIPDLKQRIRELENSLSILLGKSPGSILRNELESQDSIPFLSAGVPAQLLANRPDVLEAEYNLRSSFEMVNMAQAFFYPGLNLNGAAGLNAQEIANLVDPTSFFANIAAGLVQPILNKNVNKARLAANKAAMEEAGAYFQQTVLNASEEVSNALFAYEMANEKIDIRAEQLDALENAVSFNQELLQYGENSYVDVLTSEQNLLAAKLNAVSDELQKYSAVVELYRALGGGWR